MKQQVNLFQAKFQRQLTVASALMLTKLLGLVLLALIAVYGYQRWQLAGLEQQLADLDAQHSLAEQKLSIASAQHPLPQKSKGLESEVATMAEQLEQRNDLVVALQSGRYGAPEGFSGYLEALARQHVEGTWLTRVYLGAGGSAVGISGGTLAPELVPVYLQRLASEKVFAGKTFGSLEMTRPVEQPGRVDFVLGTTVEAIATDG